MDPRDPSPGVLIVDRCHFQPCEYARLHPLVQRHCCCAFPALSCEGRNAGSVSGVGELSERREDAGQRRCRLGRYAQLAKDSVGLYR